MLNGIRSTKQRFRVNPTVIDNNEIRVGRTEFVTSKKFVPPHLFELARRPLNRKGIRQVSKTSIRHSDQLNLRSMNLGESVTTLSARRLLVGRRVRWSPGIRLRYQHNSPSKNSEWTSGCTHEIFEADASATRHSTGF
jgi:hypothetical protein